MLIRALGQETTLSPSWSVCLSVCWSVCLSVFLSCMTGWSVKSVCLSVCWHVCCLSVCPSFYLSVFLFVGWLVRWSICWLVGLSVCCWLACWSVCPSVCFFSFCHDSYYMSNTSFKLSWLICTCMHLVQLAQLSKTWTGVKKIDKCALLSVSYNNPRPHRQAKDQIKHVDVVMWTSTFSIHYQCIVKKAGDKNKEN